MTPANRKSEEWMVRDSLAYQLRDHSGGALCNSRGVGQRNQLVIHGGRF
jgi:hypothetical protein